MGKCFFPTILLFTVLHHLLKYSALGFGDKDPLFNHRLPSWWVFQATSPFQRHRASLYSAQRVRVEQLFPVFINIYIIYEVFYGSCFYGHISGVCLCAQSLQSCLTLCDPKDCQPPRLPYPQDSPGKNTGVGCHALLQGIFLTQGSNPCLLCLCIHRQVIYHQHQLGSTYQWYAQSLSLVQLFETPWTVTHHAALSMRFSRQEYWSGLPCPLPWDFPKPQGSNPSLPQCGWIIYHLSHRESPVSGEIASFQPLNAY